MNICFDVDSCLINKEKEPISANVVLLKELATSHKVFVWSGNGWRYALDQVVRLGLQETISGVLNKYNTFKPDIAFDDQEIDLGRLNICVS